MRRLVLSVLALVGALVAVSGGSAAPPATGYVYWGSGAAVGRANLDGTGVNKSFITTGGSTVDGVAVDANYVYWMEVNFSPDSASIGRANLDGTGVNENFINLSWSNNRNASYPGAITVDGSYIYWADPDGAGISRANLNGTGVDLSFIGSAGEVSGLAVDGNFIYWAGPGGGVGRANLNGTSVNTSFISGLYQSNGVAVDSNYVYWTTAGGENGTPRLGRANLDGTGVNSSFISGAGTTGYPFGGSGGLAIDGDAIFSGAETHIDRTNIDGSCRARIVGGVFSGQAIAVTPGITTSPPVKFAVTYVGNRATGGSPPVDASSPYSCGATVTVRGPGSLTRAGYVFNGWALSPGAGTGTGWYRPGNTISMPASTLTLYAQWAKKLSPGTTTCNATFAGTGAAVTVPPNGRCTLIPGTHVTGGITVHAGGALTMNGVTVGGTISAAKGTHLSINGGTIGGALSISEGSAVVCGGKIGHGVTTSHGSLVLGRTGCAGNHITGNVLIQHYAHVRVQGNTITGNLTVTYGTSIPDSIVGNTVSGKLLVSYSGPPVEVSNNHAATASCIGNKGQTGSGNVATGTNTCPH